MDVTAFMGAWTFDRVKSAGPVQSERLQFFHDMRYGSWDSAGAVTWGSWKFTEREEDREACLVLQPDGGNAGVYQVAMDEPPAGPFHLRDADRPGARWSFYRALPRDRRIAGRWIQGPNIEESFPKQLQLDPHGKAQLRFSGGVQREGRWCFERFSRDAAGAGILHFRPTSPSLPDEAWELGFSETARFTLVSAGKSVPYERWELASEARFLVARWRSTEENTLFEELRLLEDGSGTLRETAKSSGIPLRWSYQPQPSEPGTLRGALTLQCKPAGLPTETKRWKLEISTEFSALLYFHREEGGTPYAFRGLLL